MAEQESNSEEMPNYTCLYFGYASNLSPRTMKQRCPGALFVGLARLDGWRWIVSKTGYANIIRSADDFVYGALYFLTNKGESLLDIIEGVPWEMQKYKLEAVRAGPGIGDAEGQKVQVMTHVDGVNLETGQMENDYIVWVNRAIEGGLKCGVPAEYIEKYLRPFTPPDNDVQEIRMVQTGLGSVRMTPNAQFRPMPIDVELSKGQEKSEKEEV